MRLRMKATIILLSMLVFLLSACSGSPSTTEQGASPHPSDGPVSEVIPVEDYTTDLSVQNTKDPLEISSNKNTKEDKSPATDKKEDEASFDSKNPKLAGISMQDSKETLVKKLGKPADQYTIEEDAASILVYEYKGYSIGFNENDLVQFIEVNSKDIPTGLKGVRIDSTSQDAVKALGQPENDSDVVMNYSAKDSLLKLDVDPKTHKIQSIKLFVVKAE